MLYLLEIQAPLKSQLVRKSNDLVEARFRFDLYEMRLFLKMVSMVNREDADFQVYRIALHDIVQDFELGNSGYERLRDAARRLMSKVITLYLDHDLGVMRFETPVVVGLGSFDKNSGVGERFIEISFHPNLKPHLLNLKSRFLLYDIRNVLRLPSTHSIRMFELLKQYERIGKRRFQVDELKDILGVADSYPLYGNFKQRILEKARLDLKKHTDIFFTYEENKRGRSVYELIFHIHSNAPDKKGSKLLPEPEAETAHSISPEAANVLQQVNKWVNEATVEEWLKRYPAEQVQVGVDYTLKQLESGARIANVGGYLAKMVATDNIRDAKAEVQEKAARQSASVAKLDERRQRLEARKTELMQVIAEEENALIAGILQEEAVFESVFQKIRNGRWGSFFDANRTDIENYRSVMTVRAAVNNEVKARFTDRFSKTTEEKELELVMRELSRI